MRGNPAVTVLMPVFNGALYVREAIESIRSQTFTDWELLVIDDGSADETPAILTRCSAEDRRIVVHRQENNGIVSALNTGLKRARGAYIARMDADDISAPERLARQVQAMEADPGIAACGSDYRLFGARRGVVHVPRSDRQCKELLLLRACFAHPTVMMRTQLLADHGLEYRIEYQLAEDYDLWSRLAEFGRFVNVPSPLLRYRVHPAQASSAKRAQQQRVHARISARNFARAGVSVSDLELLAFSHPRLAGVANPLSYFKKIMPTLTRCVRGSKERAFLGGECARVVARNCALLLLTRDRQRGAV